MQKIRSRVGLCTFILIFFFAGLLVFLNQYRKHAREWFLHSRQSQLGSTGPSSRRCSSSSMYRNL